MKREIEDADYVSVTPIKVVKKDKVTFGESTFVRPETNLIVIKKTKKRK